MIRILTGLFLLVPAAAAQAGHGEADARRADRDAIRAHIDSIFRAFMRKDEAALRATHGEAWRGFLSGSRTTLRGIDAYMQRATANLARPGRMLDYEMLEFDVVFYGDVAVVPYIAEIDYQLGDEQLARKLRVLDVYAKLNGDWIQVASNTGRHPDTIDDDHQLPWPLSADEQRRLFAARDRVWRAFFANDEKALRELVPPEARTISAVAEEFGDLESILAASRQSKATGVELVELEFPKTEVQRFGDVAIVYATYRFVLRQGDADPATYSGRVTEVFVERGGNWVNPGWHLDSGPSKDG